MNFKKLKRCLSVVLSATMILSSNMTGFAAEITADPAAPAEESQVQEPAEHEHQWQLVESLKGIERYACTVDGCTATKNEVAPSADDTEQTNPDEVQPDADISVEQGTNGNMLSGTPSGNDNVVSRAGTCGNHVVVAVSRQAPTCLEKGMASFYTCSACEEKYRTRTDAENQENAIPADQVDAVLGIEKRDHRAVEVPEQEATCTQDGNTKYYTCPLCGEYYRSIEELYADAIGNRTNIVNKDGVVSQATGHVYEDEGTRTVSFEGWNSFDFKAFVEGEANGITASRRCTNENCDVEGGYVQQAASVAVSKTAPDANFDCTTGGDSNTVTYTAVATFEDSEDNPSAVGTSNTEQEAKPLVVSDHAFTYVLTWDQSLMMNENGELAYDPDRISVTRVCNICGKNPADVTPADVQVELTEDGMSDEHYQLKCTAEGPFEFTATATDNGKVVKTETRKLMLPIGRHSLDWVEGSEPTCSTSGKYAHYVCTNSGCGNRYWDETDAQKGTEPLTNEEINRPALGHNFMNPTFEFGTYPAAVAKFTCRRGDITIRKTCDVNLTAGDWKKEQPNAKCGDLVNVTYPASVDFDGNHIKQNDDGTWTDDLGAEGYSALTYPGSAVQENVVLKHEYKLVPDSLKWVDEPATGEYVDPSKGVTATLKCEQCQCQAVLKTVDGETTVEYDANNDSGITTRIEYPVLMYTLNANKSTPATCQDEGTDLYNVTISGTVFATDTASSPISITDQTLDLTTKASGHKYVIDGEPVEGAAGTGGVPTISTMTIKCAVDGCDFTPISYDSVTSGDVTVNIAQEDTEGENGYSPATCTDAGNIVWVADIEVTDANGGKGKVFKSYDTSWNGIPWTKTEVDPAKGHDYSDTPVFDWSEYGEITDDGSGNKTIVPYDGEHDVYLVYTCKTTGCTHVADANETPAVEGTTYDVVDGKRVKKVVAEVTKSTVTDCESVSGGRTHTATVTDGQGTSHTESATETIGGHVWNAVTWGEWEVDSTNPTIEVTLKNGKKKSIPNYTVSATRTCKICDQSETLTTTADVTTGRVIEITPVTEAETCTAAGSTIYWAKAITTPEDISQNIEEVAEDCSTPYVHIYKATGHTYDINWTWYGKVKGSDTEQEISSADEKNVTEYTKATVTKACTECNKEIGLDTSYGATEEAAGTGIVFTKPANKISCTENDVFAYTASARFLDDPGENGDVYSETRNVIRMKKDSHNYGWELEDWDPEAKTVTVIATCEDNEKHTFTEPNVSLSVTSEDSADATCVSGAKQVVTGTFTVTDPKDNKVYTGTGTYSNADDNIDPDKHLYTEAEPDWTTLTEVDKNDQTVTFEMDATVKCDNAPADETHNKQGVKIVATAPIAEIEQINCAESYDIHYTLSIKGQNGENADESLKGITIKGGDTETKHHDATSHELKRVDAEPGSCNKAGWKAYYHCSVCGRNYSSYTGATEVTVETIAPLGHLYGDPTFEWVEEGKTARAIYTCMRPGCTTTTAGHTKVVNASVDTTPDNIYHFSESTCKSGKPEPVQGVWYYMVQVTDNGNTVDGDLAVTQPYADHNFVNGKCEWCGQEGLVKVTFVYLKNGTPVEISNLWVGEDDIVAPSAPNLPGYTFEGWSLDGKKSTDLKADIEEAAASSQNITVTALYNPVGTEGTVMVKYQSGGVELDYAKPDNGDEYKGLVGKNVTVSADENIEVGSEGEKYVFSHWSNGNTTLSTNLKYDVYVASIAPVTVYAVYEKGSERPAAVPVVAVADIYKFTAPDNTNKLAFTTTMSIPEGYTFKESGILYSVSTEWADKEVAELNDLIVLNASGVLKSTLNGTKTNLLSVKISDANKDRTIYARGYLICTNPDGVDEVYYSDSAFSTYNDARTLN